MTKDKEIRNLLELFFAGETTVRQERRLAELFRSDDLPGDLEQYRPMFAWYDGMAARQTGQRRFRLWRLVAAAAAVVVIATVSLDALVRFHRRSVMQDMYAGSYIVRNGVKITDIDVVLSEARRAEARADMLDRQFDSEKQKLTADVKNIEDKYFNSYNF